MKLNIGAALTLVMVTIPAYLVWWLSTNITDWFTYHAEAGDALMWSLVTALILSVFAIPAAAWGIAARMWVMRLRDDERAESTARVLRPSRPAPSIRTITGEATPTLPCDDNIAPPVRRRVARNAMD